MTVLRPPTVRATTIRDYRVVAAAGRAPLRGESQTESDVWAYDGRVPGPTLRVHQGETMRIVVENKLSEDTTVHWHGIRLPNAMDGVPEQLEGCHTMFVNGYVVDGHVPVEVIRRLLTERPAVAGITLPGMPMGSPGMPGGKTVPFTIYAFTTDGKAPTVYATE